MTASPTTGTHVASTTPYPWPWNGDLSGYGTAVAVVVPRGGWPTVEPACAAAARAVAAAVRSNGGTVLVVSTAAPGRGSAEAAGPPVDILPAVLARLAVDPADIRAVIDADGIDGFSGSRLDGLLHALGIERLILVGAGLETCIHSTMRSANDRGFECLLVIDASAPYDPNLVPAAVSMIEMSGGIFGAVAASADVISAFPTPAFPTPGA